MANLLSQERKVENNGLPETLYLFKLALKRAVEPKFETQIKKGLDTLSASNFSFGSTIDKSTIFIDIVANLFGELLKQPDAETVVISMISQEKRISFVSGVKI